MSNPKTISDIELDSWIGLVMRGMANAISGLSEMIGQEVKATSLSAKRILVKDAPNLLGWPETITVGIYLAVSGDATGHMVLVYQPKTALELVDLLMGNPPGSTQSLGEMEQSALAEIGNIMGSFFLNTLADETGMNLHPSPPAVMMDMAGAILDPVLAEILVETDDAVVVEAIFGTKDRQINGTFLALPNPNLQKQLISHWESR